MSNEIMIHSYFPIKGSRQCYLSSAMTTILKLADTHIETYALFIKNFLYGFKDTILSAYLVFLTERGPTEWQESAT